jgi:hypothetical protein
MIITKSALTWLAALSALAAAFLWYKASAVRAEPDPNDLGGSIIVNEGEQALDFIATALEQTRWNKRAAAAACTSAIFQAIALVLPE